MKHLLIVSTLILSFYYHSEAQMLTKATNTFTLADSVRGTLSPIRACYDVYYYDLNIKVSPELKSISGYNSIYYHVVEDFRAIQVDLFDRYDILSIMYNEKELNFQRNFNSILIHFPEIQKKGAKGKITITYEGTPIEAKRAPWDGGFVWKKDNDGVDWIGVACEGMGASSWWPNKDHLSDEPDSMQITCSVPDPLKFIGNGNLRKTTKLDNDYTAYTWFVSYPINNYNVTLNIGNYVQFQDVYVSPFDGSKLDLDYYVMPYNLEKAKVHFEQVKPMMKCFEEVLGKYPFWNDGFALVETPYLGMEHQGAIAYGNDYKTGYSGMDYSRIGLDFDYIIIHEAGHEWWGNSVSCSDLADLWIHEGFCTYSEAIYVECMFDYPTAIKYINATKSRIGNDEAIIGYYDVNDEGSGDMYAKGSLFLNTLRHVINDDALWWEIIYEIANVEFKHKNTNTKEILAFFNKKTGMELDKIFEQYLNYPKIPKLEYRVTQKKKRDYVIECRWVTDVAGFEMPVKLKNTDKDYIRVELSNEWSDVGYSGKSMKDFAIDDDLVYIEVKNTDIQIKRAKIKK